MNRTPRPETLRRLATALGLPPPARAALGDAAWPGGGGGPAAARHNLPVQLTGFVGRGRELAVVAALLGGEPGTPWVRPRLVTLTGTGGCGKTRLALEAAADALDRFPDGVWLVELAPLADAERVPAAVAAGLGLALEPGLLPTAQLLEWLRPKRTLLVLDNCEHLLDACARLADGLLRSCPRVQVLATSREALGVAGETAWRVPSLALPDADLARPLTRQELGPAAAARLARLAQGEAVRLFVERAVAVAPEFVLTPENAPAVAQVCRRLDGVPLALELAAARVPVLAVEQLAARLDDAFRLLTGGSRTALPRQQTLRATLDWSHALLSGPERAVLRRAAVFVGGFTLEAAEAVCAAPGVAPEVEAGEVLDLVGRLVAKSLVQAETRGAVARYRLLETIRLYGRERLVAAGEAAAARDRHLAWCLHLVEGMQGTGDGRGGPERVAVGSEPFSTGELPTEPRLAGEHDNLRAALEWARDGDAPAGLRLATGLGSAWARTHLLPDPGGWLDGLLARAPAPGTRRAWGLMVATVVHRMYGALDPARGHLREARAYFEQTGDRYGLARVVDQEGFLAAGEGHRARARACFEASLAALRGLGHPQVEVVLRNVGVAAIGQGDLGRARAVFEESAALARARGALAGGATVRLGVVARLEGDSAGARAHFEACLTHPPDDGPGVPFALGGLGDLARDAGDYARARAYYHRLGGLGAGAGEVPASFRGVYLSRLGILAVRQGAVRRGARLLGAVPPAGVAFLRMHAPDVDADYEAAVAAARAALGAAAFAAAWAAGRAMTPEQAVAEARDEAPDALDAPNAP